MKTSHDNVSGGKKSVDSISNDGDKERFKSEPDVAASFNPTERRTIYKMSSGN